ncbi:hypothetical protein VTJ04DRAFT_8639 [Mycothermus thermophilus]|uniref:uncharacterized protein n=1 Tax=Humicola insolens TaxID=85995 RepID=UPI0037434753
MDRLPTEIWDMIITNLHNPLCHCPNPTTAGQRHSTWDAPVPDRPRQRLRPPRGGAYCAYTAHPRCRHNADWRVYDVFNPVPARELVRELGALRLVSKRLCGVASRWFYAHAKLTWGTGRMRTEVAREVNRRAEEERRKREDRSWVEERLEEMMRRREEEEEGNVEGMVEESKVEKEDEESKAEAEAEENKVEKEMEESIETKFPDSSPCLKLGTGLNDRLEACLEEMSREVVKRFGALRIDLRVFDVDWDEALIFSPCANEKELEYLLLGETFFLCHLPNDERGPAAEVLKGIRDKFLDRLSDVVRDDERVRALFASVSSLELRLDEHQRPIYPRRFTTRRVTDSENPFETVDITDTADTADTTGPVKVPNVSLEHFPALKELVLNCHVRAAIHLLTQLPDSSRAALERVVLACSSGYEWDEEDYHDDLDGVPGVTSWPALRELSIHGPARVDLILHPRNQGLTRLHLSDMTVEILPLLAMVTRGPSTALDIDVNIMEDEHVPIEEMLKVRVGDGADSPLRALVLDRVSLDVFERWGMFMGGGWDIVFDTIRTGCPNLVEFEMTTMSYTTAVVDFFEASPDYPTQSMARVKAMVAMRKLLYTVRARPGGEAKSMAHCQNTGLVALGRAPPSPPPESEENATTGTNGEAQS